jgi:ADP-ribose pyrophosphatase YjhB (NUDIX family)
VPVDRYASIVDVHVILRRGGRVLLLRRAGDTYASGQLCLPLGHLGQGEHRASRRPRNLRKTSITVDPAVLRHVLSIHQRNPGTDHAPIGFAFEPSKWDGEPANAEPHKHSALVWAEPTRLPPPSVMPVSSPPAPFGELAGVWAGGLG